MPFNVIGPQRPRPIYTWPLGDHQSHTSQPCDLLKRPNKYKQTKLVINVENHVEVT